MFAAIFLSFVHASIDPLSNSALLNGGIAASLAPTAATSQLVPEPAAARAGAAVAATAPVEESVGGGVIPMGGEIVHIKETFNTTADLLAIKHHKGIMPLETWDYVGVVLALVGAAFANAGGAGGGGIFVPMLILVMGFNAHEAIPLSKAMIFGGAITFLALTITKRHPNANRPLIDYDIALMFEPMVLCGTTAGVLLNRTLPSWLILLMLELLLAQAVYKTLKKGISYFRAETIRLAAAGGVPGVELAPVRSNDATDGVADAADFGFDDSDDDEEAGGTGGDGFAKATAAGDNVGQNAADVKELAALLETEAIMVPVGKVLLVVFVWVCIFVLAMVRGGHGAESILGIKRCTMPYWMATLAVYPICIAVTVWVGSQLRASHTRKVALGYVFAEGDVRWNKKNSIFFPLFVFLAGVAAGLLGIGGGLVLGPMLLEMNVIPRVSAATSSFMVLFTASCTSIQFAVLGLLRLDYAAMMMCCTAIGAVVGILIVAEVVRKLGRPSVIVISLGLVIAASAVLIPMFGVRDVMAQVHEGKNIFAFHPFCE